MNVVKHMRPSQSCLPPPEVQKACLRYWVPEVGDFESPRNAVWPLLPLIVLPILMFIAFLLGKCIFLGTGDKQ